MNRGQTDREDVKYKNKNRIEVCKKKNAVDDCIAANMMTNLKVFQTLTKEAIRIKRSSCLNYTMFTLSKSWTYF